MEKWQVLSSEYVLANPWLKVRKDRCRTPSDVIIEDYYVIERHDFVMMFAVAPDGRVVLVKQYKHGAGQILRELPAGYVEHGEEPRAAAKRELLEETGFRAGRIVPVATLLASPAVLTTRAYIFYCDELEAVGAQSLDEGENIEVELVELSQLREAVSRNELVLDCASLAAVLSVIEKLERGQLI